MNNRYLLEAEGTAKINDWNPKDLNGMATSLFYRKKNLVDVDLVNTENGSELIDQYDSREKPLQGVSFKSDAPVLRILNRKQEGHSLTFQKWKGVVVEISETIFVANLTDSLNDGLEEQAEFYNSDISPDDQTLLTIGACFYWWIGYVITPSNQMLRSSLLRFQRLPLFSKESIDKTAEKVQTIKNLLDC